MGRLFRHRQTHVSFDWFLTLNYKQIKWIYFRQDIIGLRQYETKELLVELFYLTFLVVTTAIQLLIFHKKYTKQYSWKSSSIEKNIGNDVNSNGQNNPEQNEPADKTYLESVSRPFYYQFSY